MYHSHILLDERFNNLTKTEQKLALDENNFYI